MPRLLVSQATATHVEISGRRVLSFGGCNYLGLAHHPAVHAAMLDGLARFGLSTSASRETTGNTTAHDRLESALCGFLGMPAAVVVPDGYSANLAIAQALVPSCSTALIDERSHKSIREAAKCAGMALVEYDHLDAAHAAELMREHESRGVAVMTDGVFTADGSLAPVSELLAALPPTALLIVDDCHGLCTVGPGGRGTLAHYGLRDPRLILTTTLAKGLGCHGGVVAGPIDVCDRVRNRASAYICTTPVSPAIAAAACEALAVVQREPERIARLAENARRLGSGLRDLGIKFESSLTPIFAFTLDSEQRMRRLAAELLAEGILAPLISYPGGPATCYFRLSVTSEHTSDQIDRLLTEFGKRLKAAVPTRVAV
jgi:7-keto-8-aminopelargonate synthetase-like enzyme